MKISNKNIERFINYYGAGDFYVNHEWKSDGSIVITYFPSLQKIMNKSALKKISATMEHNMAMYEKYLNKIVIKDNTAKIITTHEFYDDTLEKNFPLFLKDMQKKEIHQQCEVI